MKKVVLIFCMLFISSLFIAPVSAQTSTFVKGDNVLGVGIGFGGVSIGSSYFGYTYSSTPYITGYLERCFFDNIFDEKSSIGIGGMIGYKSRKYVITGSNNGWKETHLLFGARGAFHYTFVDKLDTYAGSMIGFRVYSDKYLGSFSTKTTSSSSGLFTDFFAGARYYFTDSFAGFVELGYGWGSAATIGLSLKF